jgi:hypothetical protein
MGSAVGARDISGQRPHLENSELEPLFQLHDRPPRSPTRP